MKEITRLPKILWYKWIRWTKVKQCLLKVNIEKYGTLSENEPRVIEKEIIVEKEIIKEIPVEKIIEVQDDVEINNLKKKLETLQNQNTQASNCDELRNSVIEQQKIIRDKSIMINKLERRLKNCMMEVWFYPSWDHQI